MRYQHNFVSLSDSDPKYPNYYMKWNSVITAAAFSHFSASVLGFDAATSAIKVGKISEFPSNICPQTRIFPFQHLCLTGPYLIQVASERLQALV